jgi:tetratricopeptide (TPR) repeat protein
MGDNDGAMAAGQQALDLAAALGHHALQVHAAYDLGQVCAALGDFSRAVVLQRWSVEEADRASGTFSPSLRSLFQARLAWTLSSLGAFAESQRHGEEALRLARLDGRGQAPVVALGSLSELYLVRGDLAHALPALEQGLAVCRASGDLAWWGSFAVNLGAVYTLQGRLAEGRALLEEAANTGLPHGARRAAYWLQRSAVCQRARRDAEAWQHAHQALEVARQRKERGNEALALHQLGALHAHALPPDAEQAKAHYQQALALAEELSMRPLQAHCHLGLGRLYHQTGRAEQARAALATAIDLYRAMDMTFWLPQAEAALALVACRRGVETSG